ncbi:Cof-type HAD-IIB family hydrolase [Flavobacterium faecale]|uniref:Cof-type HAD-IIB family hydrolase n=1 Tax=Flavobacterium faecale TaxID=1355330 RepID=UPI003AAC2084
MNVWNTIKVIITDLDGTLLNPSHAISDYSKTVFRALHQKGYLIIVATGRHHLDAMPLVEPLGFPIYMVTSNGARIHAPNKELLYSFDIASETIQSVFKVGIPEEITTVLYKEKVWQTNKHNEKLNNFQPKMNYPPELVDFESLEDLSTIKLFFTHGDHTKLTELRDRILVEHSEILAHAFSLPHCLEFMDVTVDKSVAIAKILEMENYSFNQAIAFGDGFNDEKMLKAAWKGMIMRNAPVSLKNVLPDLEVVGDNTSDGVAQFLSKKFLE